jgi:hypothetical protein
MGAGLRPGKLALWDAKPFLREGFFCFQYEHVLGKIRRRDCRIWFTFLIELFFEDWTSSNTSLTYRLASPIFFLIPKSYMHETALFIYACHDGWHTSNFILLSKGS